MPCYRIFYNGNIYTFDPENPIAEALVVKNDRIEYVGTNNKALSEYHGVKYDLDGATVIPGVIDSHMHLEGFAIALSIVDLRGVESIEELKEKLKEKAKRVSKGEWILGRNWDQESFKEKRYPTRWDLDEVSTENPIFIVRVCGHVAIANSKALRIAGITRETPNPPGGMIGRDENGEPNGILWENALMLVRSKVPEPTPQQLAHLITKAQHEMLSYGITTVASVSAPPILVKTLNRIYNSGMLKIRVRLYINSDLLNNITSLGIESGFGNDYIKIQGVKTFMDGSLGGRSAALRQPYNDDPSTSGMLILDGEKLASILKHAVQNNLDVAIHAIGDRAIEEAINGVVKSQVDPKHVRFEHVSVTPPDIVDKLEKLNPLALVVQPHFRVTDWWIKERLGVERAKWTYTFKTLMSRGLILAGSSDSPVEPVNPWFGVWAAVTRGNSERLNVREALNIYTIGGSIALNDRLIGRIRKGCYADFIVLDRDPFRINVEYLKHVRPKMTIVGGEIVYRA